MCKFRAQARLSLTVIYDESRARLSNNILLFRVARVYAIEVYARGVQRRFGEFSDNRTARFSPAIARARARLIPHVDKAR